MKEREEVEEEEVCFFLLLPSHTNAGRHRPRSCDFEVVSLIKELIKGKLHGREQISEKRKRKRDRQMEKRSRYGAET